MAEKNEINYMFMLEVLLPPVVLISETFRFLPMNNMSLD